MNHIERVVVDEGVGRDSELLAQFRDRLGDRQVVFVFLASEHLGIPDIEILDKLLDEPCRTDIFLSQAAPCATVIRIKQTRKREP
jgi:hypothetical protein